MKTPSVKLAALLLIFSARPALEAGMKHSVTMPKHHEGFAMYRCRVSPDRSGASHGFVAAGGPGFTSHRDTVGLPAYK